MSMLDKLTNFVEYLAEVVLVGVFGWGSEIVWEDVKVSYNLGNVFLLFSIMVGGLSKIKLLAMFDSN
jgi:hypothetical protein